MVQEQAAKAMLGEAAGEAALPTAMAGLASDKRCQEEHCLVVVEE